MNKYVTQVTQVMEMFVPPRVRPPRSLCFSILFITVFKWNVSSPKTKCQHFPMSWALRNYLSRFFCWKRSRKIWNLHMPGPSKLFSISSWTAFERVSFQRGGGGGGGCIWWKVMSLTWGFWHVFWVTLIFFCARRNLMGIFPCSFVFNV